MANKKKRTPQSRARAIVSRWEDRNYTDAELYSIENAVLTLYLDTYNYPGAYNLRLARKFDSKEMGQYMRQADKIAKLKKDQFFDTDVYSGGESKFYLGFNYIESAK